MLTRCPACATHFRVTPEQLKARSGRVRCGECQQVFNALDTLIEEPVLAMAPPLRPSPPVQDFAASAADTGAVAVPEMVPGEVFQPPTTITEVDGAGEPAAPLPEIEEFPVADQDPGLPGNPAVSVEATDPEPAVVTAEAVVHAPAGPQPPATETAHAMPEEPAAATDSLAPEPSGADTGSATGSETTGWIETFPEPLPAPRRWPWIFGSLAALVAIAVQCALAFRVELAVLWPEGKPALVALCDLAGCEVALPAKVSLVGIEASDLHPDGAQPGRLVLTATLKNRAPFAQQFPHLELTLTDTADKAVARKVLTPADYLPAKSSGADGMPPGTDVTLAVGVEAREMAASGYRLYLFYP